MPCYDQSCTASDLVNIPSLVLSDTFNTWFDRTNQLIRVANAINVFDVGVGPTDGGLRLERGCSGNYYSGVAVFYVEQGAGIGVGTEAFTNNYNKVVIDATRLQDLGGNTASNPEVDDYFIVSDKSDTRQSPFGTPKRVIASRMLPNTVYFGETGSGTFTIQGNLNVIGNVNVQGVESYIDSNDLRIEDKIIELAYGRYAEVTVLGSGLTAGTFEAGMTAYYIDEDGIGGEDDPVPSDGNATTIGRIFSWAIGETGVSGTVRISSFTLGGVSDFQANGNLVITGSSYEGVLNVTGPLGIGDYFLDDEQLQPAGIVIKGAQGDKSFLWVCTAPEGAENWNAFVSNKNLGVSGPGNWILSSKFASYGYVDSTVNNTFTYLGEGDSYTKYSVGQQLVMEHSPTGNFLVGATFGIVNMGSTGPHILPGVPVYDWVKYFNADQLDGAHASTASVPWTIPILGAEGRLGGDLVDADAIRKRFTVSGHAFSKGDVVRFNDNGSLTFATASTIPEAEALGIIESINGNEILVVTKGFIYGLTSGTRLNAILPLVTGNVYFLSPVTPGGMIDSPDTGVGIDPGEVRKAMLLAAGSNIGYVVNYTGVVVGEEPTDTIYMSTFAPVGSIQPYAGPATRVPRSWLLCDGRRVLRNDYPDLYTLIGQSYYANASRTAPSNELRIEDDTRDLDIGDNVTVTWVIAGGATVQATGTVSSINGTNRLILVSFGSNGDLFNELPVGTPLKVYGRVAETGNSIFFIPDLRRRTPFGASEGTSIPGSGNTVPALPLGNIGGNHQITLNQGVASGSVAFGNLSATIDSLPPYITLNWIIRAKKGADATILTGHNHDLRYIRYDGEHTVDGGAANNLSALHRAQFRSNARVLSNGLDGPDVFNDSLDIYGTVTISGGAVIWPPPSGSLGGFGLISEGSALVRGNLDVQSTTRLFDNTQIGLSPSENRLLTIYGGITATRDLSLGGNVTVGRIVSGSITGGNALVRGTLTAGSVFTIGNLNVGNDILVTDDLFVGDDASVSGDASVLGKLYVNRPLSGGFGASVNDPNTRFEVLGLGRSTASVSQINADKPGGQTSSNNNVIPNRKYLETVLRNAISHVRFNANGTVVSRSGLIVSAHKVSTGTYRVGVFFDNLCLGDCPGGPFIFSQFPSAGIVVTAAEQGSQGAPYQWVEDIGVTGFTVKSAFFNGSSRVLEDRAMTVAMMNPHGIGKGDLANCSSDILNFPCE